MTSWLSFKGCSRVCGTYPSSEMMLVTMEVHSERDTHGRSQSK